MMGPYVKYSDMPGNRGITGGAIIETSHVVMHCLGSNLTHLLCNLMYIPAAEFDPDKICDKIKERFS
jgi:hypothetical protein